jgi:RHS repeat-associated protein
VVGVGSDPETGLYFYRSRYMKPGLGRFTQADRWGGSVWSPWASHPFVYCGNNPIGFVDPLGLFSLSAFTSGFQEGFTSSVKGLAKTVGIKVIAGIIGKAIPGVGSLYAIYSIYTMTKAVYDTSKLALQVANGQTSDKESSLFVGT